MNRTTKLLSLLVALVFVAGLSLACAPAPTKAPEAAPTKAPEKEEPVTIRLISQFAIGSPHQEVWSAVAEEFMTEHPNIKIEFDWAGGEFTQKFRAELAAGHPHDILWHNEPTSWALAREGVSLNLADYLENTKNYEGDKTFKDSFIPQVLERAWVPDAADGAGYYAIPTEQYIRGIFYNRAIFEQFNLQPPTTWDEFLAVCETLKENGVEPLAIDGTIPFYNVYWFMDLATRTVGAEVLYDTGLNKPGTSFKDDPAWLEVAEKIASLREKGYLMKGYEGIAWPGAQMEFVQGNAGMMLMGNWLPAEMLPNTPDDFRWGFFVFPTVEGGKGDSTTVMMKYNGYIIPKLSKHPDEAVLFAKKLVSRSAQEQSVNKLTPAVIQGVPFPETLKDSLTVLVNAKKTVGLYDELQRDAAEWMTRVLTPLHDKLIFGQITPEEFIEQLQKEHDAYWAEKE